jgi:hypothetical protein
MSLLPISTSLLNEESRDPSETRPLHLRAGVRARTDLLRRRHGPQVGFVVRFLNVRKGQERAKSRQKMTSVTKLNAGLVACGCFHQAAGDSDMHFLCVSV